MGLSPPSPFFPSPTSANDEGMATESNAVVGNKGREKKKLRARQVFSTWSEGAAANNAQS